jgi:hypothetical protein
MDVRKKEQQHDDQQDLSSTITILDKFSIGFSPVDIHGRPLLDLSNTGGWQAAFFIFGRVPLKHFSLL